jgi:hypothetical protein
MGGSTEIPPEEELEVLVLVVELELVVLLGLLDVLELLVVVDELEVVCVVRACCLMPGAA